MLILASMEADLKMLLNSSEQVPKSRTSRMAADFILTRPRYEEITKEEVKAVIESYKRMNWWP